MIRRLIHILLFLFASASIGSTAMIVWGVKDFRAPGPLSETTLVVVEKGQGVIQIADALARNGVIGAPLLFTAATRLSGSHARLRAGEYEFPAHISMQSAMGKLLRGDVYRRSVTIPEGLTSRQIVKLLERIDSLEGRIDTVPPEGSLLPETYAYERGATRQDILLQAARAMEKTLDELWQNRAMDSPALSKEEVVILASIVEKESGVTDERARIAGVFINRLRLGMRLQSDPTVIYALTGGDIQEAGMGPLGRRLLSNDLQTASPYNTYRNQGLPPGPICNPGLAALKAALQPERNDYLYFVADGAGGHVFARTLEEHNDHVAEWRKIRKSDSDKSR